MEFNKQIYFCTNLEHKRSKVLEKIRSGQYKYTYYVITIPPRYHQMELFRIVLGEQHAFDLKDHVLVGVAKDYDSGIELIHRISQEVYNTLGSLDYREYFSK